MFRNVCRFEINLENRPYQFTCELDSPIGHVKEVLVKFLQRAGEIEDQIKAQHEVQEKEKKEKEQSELISQQQVEAISA